MEFLSRELEREGRLLVCFVLIAKTYVLRLIRDVVRGDLIGNLWPLRLRVELIIPLFAVGRRSRGFRWLDFAVLLV